MARYARSDFTNGNIPTLFIEEFQVLDDSDPIARSFNARMQRIYTRLMEGLDQPLRDGRQIYPGLEKKAADHPVRFMLSASKNPNTFSVPYASPPIVIITAGAVELCEKEAQLAGLLGHELGRGE